MINPTGDGILMVGGYAGGNYSRNIFCLFAVALPICYCIAFSKALFVMMTKDMPFFIEMPFDSSPISYFRRSFLALSTIVQTDS